MMTINECKAMLDRAVTDGIIRSWKSFYNRMTDWDRPFHIRIVFNYGQHKYLDAADKDDVHNDAADYVESLYPKETEMISLEDAAKKIWDCAKEAKCRETVLVWGDERDSVRVIYNAIAHYATGKIPRISVEYVMPYAWMIDPVSIEKAAIVLRASGPLDRIQINVQKNRYGPTFNLCVNAFAKEKTMPTTVVDCDDPKCKFCHPKKYPHLHPDMGYAECFRILREAKKDGVIADWGYYTNEPQVWIMQKCDGKARFHDDGTKGDIGILREAADYALGLRNKQAMPDPDKMSYEELLNEAKKLGIRIEFNTTKSGTAELAIILPGDNLPSWRLTKDAYGLKAAIRECRVQK